MAKTQTTERTGTQQVATEATSKGELTVAKGGMTLRLPYPRALEEYAGIDARTWQVLIDAIWPAAKTVEGVCMAINYCRSRNLDPMKRMVHIVPIYSKALEREIESVWPGIAEIRATATRTGVYAGKDAAEFGPEITKTFQHVDSRNDAVKKELEVVFPEWCRVTVYKLVQGVRCAFVGPKVFWEETYATESKWSGIPNDMWKDRRSGQLEKCAESAALRAAFPEELGNEYAAEEMYGKAIDGATITIPAAPVPGGGEAIPPRPKKSEFERAEVKADKTEKSTPKKDAPAPADKAEPAKQAEPETERARNVFCVTCGDEFDIQPRATCPRCGGTEFRPRATGKNTVTAPVETKPQEKEQPAEPEEEAQEVEDATIVEETEDDGDGGAALAEALEDAYKEHLVELEQCTRIRDVTDLRERVQPDLDSAEREKHWLKACENRQLEIVNASRKKK